MRDLLIKRNELCRLSKDLRSAKFDMYIEKEDVTNLIKVQNDVYHRFKFYDEYIKNRRIAKNERKKVHTEERLLLFE